MSVSRRLRHYRDRVRATPALAAAYRVVVAVVGAGTVVLGIVLLPLPGPGWVVIFFGLGVLASEFAWARRLLRRVRSGVEAGRRWARRRTPAARLLLGAALVLVLLGLGAIFLAWRGVPSWLAGPHRPGIG